MHVTLPYDGLFPLVVCFGFFPPCKLILSWDLFPWESHVLCLTEAFLREGLFSPRLGPYKFSWLSLVGDNVNLGSTSVPGESLGFRFLWALLSVRTLTDGMVPGCCCRLWAVFLGPSS